MPPAEPAPAPEAMLAHGDFVRTLVRSLLRSSDGEDDVVQQVMVRAWRSGPRQPGRLHAWLARVARNLAIDHLRAERRRRDGGQPLRPSGDPGPSVAEVLQREEERQRVVRAVLTLPQPYRSTVLLRYWDELSPTQIAERLGEPAATIRSRLKRGLRLLRQGLDEEYGSRRGWLLALLPFAQPGESIAATTTAAAGATLATTGVLVMTKLKALLVTAACVAVGLLSWWTATAGAPASPPGSTPDQVSNATAGVAVEHAVDAPDTTVAEEPIVERHTAVVAATEIVVIGVTRRARPPQPDT
ncbi:MAG: sigma-70 family RNA polymerase sigma factor, partial [Planctomycetes bacterium]|nr:sigma-70 family RNA polymerase sigma factor [Planctomycetota bacterium]